MTPLRLLLVVLTAWPLGAAGQVATLPDRPQGHVLDTAGVLGDDRREELENELQRIRKAHDIDVHAVRWDRDLPADGDLTALATRLGETWSREDHWVVVVQSPGEEHPIAAVHGGFAVDGDRSEADAALAAGLRRGRREWTASARLAACALECAEEFIFLRNERLGDRSPAEPPGEPAAVATAASSLGETERGAQSIAAPLVIGAVAFALLVAVLIFAGWWWSRRRCADTTPPRHFPEPEWQPRLGAPWSGGSTIRARFPTSSS